MTLTPSTVRNDLKCGKGAISKGEKCTKGAAQEVIEKAAPIALGLGLAAGAIALRRRGRNPRIGDGRTVPNIPKTPPKPPPRDPAANAARRAKAEALGKRVVESAQRRARENPQQVAYEMQADKIKSAALRDVVKSKKFQDAFKSKAMSIEELGELARDPDAFDKWMRRTDSALSPRTIRQDLKCGKGAISKGEKCTKGPATATKPNNTIRNVALGVGGALAIGGAIHGVKNFRRFEKLKATKPKRSTPEQIISHGRSMIKSVKQSAVGGEIVGAGLTVAGAGMMANEFVKDPKQRQAKGIVRGAALMYLGTGTYMGGRRWRKGANEAGEEFEKMGADFKEKYYSARARAQERARQNAASGSQGSRNVGSNKAVQNPFKDLNVSESASDADIKKQWLKLMRENHPDVGGDPRKAQQINAAYQEIMRRRGKLDSIYADGFDFDLEVLGL